VKSLYQTIKINDWILEIDVEILFSKKKVLNEEEQQILQMCTYLL